MKPRYSALDTGEITGGIYWYDGVSEKTAFSGKVSHFADKFMGAAYSHQLQVRGPVQQRRQRLCLRL